MAIDTVPNLLDVIKQNQLLEPGQLNEVLPEARRFSDPRQLAQHMLKKNWLTPYQVNQIFQGQGSGLVMGQYRLLERLGEGGMGQVFKARHQAMGRIVALKVIRRDRLENETAVKRFRREIQAVAQLSHPNVVLAFDADAVAGTHFYAMEYVEGSDLSQLVKKNGPLPVWQACEYVRQAAHGLQHAHERGMVHRDIKPGNLLIARADAGLNGTFANTAPGRPKRTGGQGARPTVKILDMGLARLAEQADTNSSTAQLSHDGTVFGTPDFMAPEQAKNSHNVDWRADIYSLGCTFYYLLGGTVPYPGGTNIEKLVKHQMDQPRPVEALRNDVPVPVRAILQRMMAKRPEDRIQSCGELAQALAPYCEAGAIPRRAGVSVGGPVASPRADSVTQKLSSTFGSIRGLFVDRDTHKVRRLGIVIGAAGILSVLGLLSVVVALTTMGGGNTGRPPSGSAKQQPTMKASLPPPTTAKAPPRVALEPVIRYLPDAANNVWSFRMPEIVRSPVFRQNDNIIKANLSGFYLMLQPLGIDIYSDVERLLYVIHQSGSSVDVFVLAQGNFDMKKYQDAIERTKPRPRQKGAPKRAPIPYYHEWLPAPGETSSTFMAMINANTFVFGTDERTIVNALVKPTLPRANQLQDRDVQAQLESLDDKPAMFLVVGGSLSSGGKSLLEANDIRAVTFGFRPGDDLQGEYSLVARDGGQSLQHYRTNAVSVFREFLQKNIDDTGTLASGLTNATPSVNEVTNTVTAKARYTPQEVGKIFKKN